MSVIRSHRRVALGPAAVGVVLPFARRRWMVRHYRRFLGVGTPWFAVYAGWGLR